MNLIYLGYHGDGHVDRIVDIYGEEVVGRHSHSPYAAALELLQECGSDLWPEREDDLADQVRDHHGTHSSGDIRTALDGREFVVLFDNFFFDDPDIRLLRHGLDPTRVVECGACEGEGGGVVQTTGHIGHETPPEKVVECHICEGWGECELVELVEEFGVSDLVKWYGGQEVAA